MANKKPTPGRALPGEYFTSTQIFAEELQRIFVDRWLYATHESALPQPGSHVLAEPIPDEGMILMRGEDGVIRTFYNICRHRGARLCSSSGQLPSNCLRCPYHAWTYKLDGRLLGAPHMATVAEFDRAENSLRSIATAVWQGLVFINFNSTPVALEQTLAPMLAPVTPWQLSRLVIAERVTYDVAANWKLLFQNFCECYHCPFLHPTLEQLTPDALENDEAFAVTDSADILGGPMRLVDPEGSLTVSGDRCGPPLVTGPERTHVHYFSLFPNMFISLHADYVLMHRLEPVAVDRTRVVCEWLFDPAYAASADAKPHEAVAFWDRVNREDWNICELVQQGVRSRGYVPGIYAEDEGSSAAFDRAYLEALGQSPASDD